MSSSFRFGGQAILLTVLDLLDLDGQVVGTLERPVPPTVVTDEIRQQEKARRLAEIQSEGGEFVMEVRDGGGGGGRVDPAVVQRLLEQRLETMTFAEAIPVIEKVAVDAEGRIWVQRSSGVPGAMGPTDILTADGRYLGTLPPDGIRIPEAFGPGGLIVHLESDELEVTTLVVERLPAIESSG
jgi:hypothetical protein